VTYVVDPPPALLSVEGDGRGLAPGRRDSYGLESMRDRVEDVSGVQAIAERFGGGTRIEVVVGEPRGRVRSALSGASPVGDDPWRAPGAAPPMEDRQTGESQEGESRADQRAAR
jgi:hypothetical protein